MSWREMESELYFAAILALADSSSSSYHAVALAQLHIDVIDACVNVIRSIVRTVSVIRRDKRGASVLGRTRRLKRLPSQWITSSATCLSTEALPGYLRDPEKSFHVDHSSTWIRATKWACCRRPTGPYPRDSTLSHAENSPHRECTHSGRRSNGHGGINVEPEIQVNSIQK